jgi:predicted ATPase
MVQVVDYLEQQDVLRAPAQAVERTLDAGVPQGIKQLLDAQLERLTAAEQQVLEVGSVAGVEFVVASVAAGVPTTPEAIEAVCDRLARQGQFLEDRGLAAWPDGTVSGRYGFRHALYQEVVYQRLSAGRRARLHLLVGGREEVGYGARAPEVAAALALHFEQGQDDARAVRYRWLAAEKVLQRYAYHEAITHLTRGLALLSRLPQTPERVRQELAYQMALGPALMTVKGYGAPEAAQVYTRARLLCQQLGERPALFPVLWGLWRYYVGRAEHETARELAAQLLTLAQRRRDPAVRLLAHRALGTSCFWVGALAEAHRHLEQGLALDVAPPPPAVSASYLLDPGVGCRAYAAMVRWHLGYPEQAAQLSQEALPLAAQLAHAHSLAYALYHAAFVAHLCGQRPRTYEWAEAAVALSQAQGFAPIEAIATILRGWAWAGPATERIAQISQGIAAYRASGAELAGTWALGLLAEAYGQGGQAEEGLHVVATALTAVHTTGERAYEAELQRIQGELWLRHQPTRGAEAEGCFRQALAVARQQQARALELRAAIRLARLWRQPGQRAAAYEVLAPIYGRFTEGFNTADLQEARALLAELG